MLFPRLPHKPNTRIAVLPYPPPPYGALLRSTEPLLSPDANVTFRDISQLTCRPPPLISTPSLVYRTCLCSPASRFIGARLRGRAARALLIVCRRTYLPCFPSSAVHALLGNFLCIMPFAHWVIRVYVPLSIDSFCRIAKDRIKLSAISRRAVGLAGMPDVGGDV